MWQVITTDTQTAATPATVETDDLVLRMGRLAFANPGWTPAVRQRASRKPPHLLAPDHASLITVLDAVHRAADAIARMAEADLAAVGIVGDAGRLYMPNTVLWDEHAQARNFAAAPPDRVMLLRDVYQVIVNASKRAAEALDGLALNARTPSKILALARQVTATGTPDHTLDLAVLAPRLKAFTQPKRTRTRQPDKAHHDQHPGPPETAPAPTSEPASTEAPQIRRGPFESRVRALASADPGLLLRAAAIDKAGHDLIDQVLSRAKAEDLTPNAARLAAQDIPAPSAPGRPSKPQPTTARPAHPHSSQTPRRAASR
jgi:hypothetical protein